MDLGCRLRIILAAAIAVSGAGSIALASAVEAGLGGLQPDLVTLAPLDEPWLDLHVTKKKGTLRLSNRIGNHGDGPLELLAGAVDPACTLEGQYAGDDLAAVQRVFNDTNGDGVFEREDEGADYTDEQIGCFEYHPAEGHQHWHFQDFSQYKLVDSQTGEPVAGPSKKIGFCIVDNFPAAFPDLPGAPASGHYPVGGCGFRQPTAGPGEMGLSVGYADTYTYVLPGQRLDVTGVPRGVYCLVSTANPADKLIEESDANNARRTPIKLNPDKDKVKEVAGGCVSAPKS
jgi:hypothetical protein